MKIFQIPCSFLVGGGFAGRGSEAEREQQKSAGGCGTVYRGEFLRGLSLSNCKALWKAAECIPAFLVTNEQVGSSGLCPVSPGASLRAKIVLAFARGVNCSLRQ
jgi:hypothetical protein